MEYKNLKAGFTICTSKDGKQRYAVDLVNYPNLLFDDPGTEYIAYKINGMYVNYDTEVVVERKDIDPDFTPL